MMISSVELTGHQTGNQAAEGSADLVAAGGEPLADHGDDTGLDAGELRGELDVVGDLLIQAAGLLGLVLPGDAEKVQGIDVPQTDIGKLCLDLLRDQLRVLHLGKSRDDNVVFLGLLDVMSKAFLVDAKINHCFFLLFLSLNMSKGYTWKCRNDLRSCRRIW